MYLSQNFLTRLVVKGSHLLALRSIKYNIKIYCKHQRYNNSVWSKRHRRFTAKQIKLTILKR